MESSTAAPGHERAGFPKAYIYCAAILLACGAAAAAPRGPKGPELAGIPFEFLLFGMTLLGVALFHHFTLQVAVSGLVSISVFKIAFTGIHLGHHLQHEWVVLVNLLCLLLGFALLSNHFEVSGIPDLLPRWLPNGWAGGFVLLALVFVLSPDYLLELPAEQGGDGGPLLGREDLHLP